jgi:hypothetical protein
MFSMIIACHFSHIVLQESSCSTSFHNVPFTSAIFQPRKETNAGVQLSVFVANGDQVGGVFQFLPAHTRLLATR